MKICLKFFIELRKPDFKKVYLNWKLPSTYSIHHIELTLKAHPGGVLSDYKHIQKHSFFSLLDQPVKEKNT